MHSSLQQQQQKKIQSDHPGGRLTNWNTPNIPAIKTEPREASPQPFNLYRGISDMTPSPQPLSPPNNYNHPNTPSPYNMVVAGNNPLMSPNHQYQGSTGVGGGGVPSNTDPMPIPLEMHNEFNAFRGGQPLQLLSRQYVRQTELTQQQDSHTQSQHRQNPLQQQQQYHNIPYANTEATHWEEKYSNALPVMDNTSTAALAMNNLNVNHNLFNMQNLTSTATAGTVAAHPHWNFPPNHENAQLQQQQHQHHMQNQQQQPSQSSFQQPPNNNHDTTIVNQSRSNNAGNANNCDTLGDAEQGPTISNLLNFDSGQLVHINSEEQQMLRLTSEELRLSNLSISS